MLGGLRIFVSTSVIDLAIRRIDAVKSSFRWIASIQCFVLSTLVMAIDLHRSNSIERWCGALGGWRGSLDRQAISQKRLSLL